MDAYSADLRMRVLEACEEMPQREVAEAFKVSLSFITKLRRRQRQTGSIAPKSHGGGRLAALNPGHHQQVRQLVKEQADATLAEYCQRLADRHAPRVSGPTMCRLLAKLGLARKKRASMPRSAIRHGSGSCVAYLSGRWPRFRPRSLSAWMKPERRWR